MIISDIKIWHQIRVKVVSYVAMRAEWHAIVKKGTPTPSTHVNKNFQMNTFHNLIDVMPRY